MHVEHYLFVFGVFIDSMILVCAGGDKHRLLSQVVRPQEPLLRSPPRAAPSDDKHGHWKDEERRGGGDKREARSRHDELEPRVERSRGGDRRGDHLLDTPPDSRSRGRDQRESTPPAPPLSVLTAGSEDRESAGIQSNEEGKKKTKSLKKVLKKVRKDEDVGPGTRLPAAGDRFNPEPPTDASADGPPSLHSPRKGTKKKVLDRKRKRSRGESDQSEDDTAAHQMSKKKRGPRTPPPSMRPDHRSTGGNTELSDNFSDWSDEEMMDRRGPMETQALLAPAERAPAEPLRRGGGPRVGRDRERCNPPAIAPLLLDPPMQLQTLTPQPLMSQPLLRKLPPEQTRSSSMGSNQSRASSRRLRSPSNDSAHRDDPQCPRARRGRLQANSRDRERERERERPVVNDPPGAERKSRIDQLRRGEPSRSTSSGKCTLLHILWKRP